MTVLGPVAPAGMGIVQTHEHLILDASLVAADPYDAILYDGDLAGEELARFKEAGVGCGYR